MGNDDCKRPLFASGRALSVHYPAKQSQCKILADVPANSSTPSSPQMDLVEWETGIHMVPPSARAGGLLYITKTKKEHQEEERTLLPLCP
jgi:hypothetical protein